jgi:hypothetical protein
MQMEIKAAARVQSGRDMDGDTANTGWPPSEACGWCFLMSRVNELGVEIACSLSAESGPTRNFSALGINIGWLAA